MMKWTQIFILLSLVGLFAGESWCQPAQPRERRLTVQDSQPAGPEVEAYKNLPKTGGLGERLGAYQDFVARYPGTQLALRAMKEVCVFYILQEKNESGDPLVNCADWLRNQLMNSAYDWSNYRNGSESLFIDRIKIQILLGRILASTARYDEALGVLADVLTEAEKRPDIWQVHNDLLQEIEFTRCWCFHGKRDYATALRLYENFMDSFPASDFVPGALRNAANCLKMIDPEGYRDQISMYLGRLGEEYRGSPEATEALRQTNPVN